MDRDDLFFEFYDLFLPSNGVLGMPYLHLGRSDAGEDISDLLLMLLNLRVDLLQSVVVSRGCVGYGCETCCAVKLLGVATA